MERNECRMAVRIASFLRIERSLMSSECLVVVEMFSVSIYFQNMSNIFVTFSYKSSNAARWMEGLRFDWMKN
ncbi:hypothetical protein T09_4493 [Trichinella sp. T9]|nr:hypothetical protein T09_4493 [Trichinella sp. T9]